VKKGRHRRFEEARKLKQQGPEAFLPAHRNGGVHDAAPELDNEFEDIAEKYGAFDDDDEEDADEA
jgi:hypothetical protein